MHSVEQRLDRIELMLVGAERRARNWRRAAIASSTVLALGVCGALVAPSASVMETLRTTRLEIIGADGKAVLVATGSPSGGQLDIWSKSGANTLRLGSSDFGGDLVLWNETGQQVLSAFATKDGGRLESSWADGKPGFQAGVSRERGAAISIVNANGKEVLYAGSNTLGAGLVRVGDMNGATATALASGTGGGVFEAFSSSGAPLAVIGAGEGGKAGMIQISTAAANRASASAPNAASSPSAASAASARPVFEVDARSDGSGRLTIGSGGDANIVLESSTQDMGLLSFFTGGKRVAAIGCSSAGGQMNIAGLDGQPALVLGAASDGPGGALTVRGADGQPIVRASVDARGDGEVVVYSASGQRKRVITSE